jgi:predicted nucleic-acid-binding Zn-ribbon protein
MTNYKWRCQACENVNEPGIETCVHCGCPASANTTDVESHRAQFKARQGKPYKCTKCGHSKYEIGEIRAAGSLISSIIEIETKKFTHVTCQQCGYTEFYRVSKNIIEAMLDYGM